MWVRDRSPKRFCASLSAAAAIEMGLARPAPFAVRTCFATAKVCWKSRFSDDAQGAGALGGPHRLLDLPEDLRLADHHRVEAARDAEGMPHRRLVPVRVQVAFELQPVAAWRARSTMRAPALAVGAAVDLGAVAGGHQHRIGHPGLAGELRQSIALALRREGELLPDLQGGAVVVDAENVQCHQEFAQRA
jgi:hypothetical protein